MSINLFRTQTIRILGDHTKRFSSAKINDQMLLDNIAPVRRGLFKYAMTLRINWMVRVTLAKGLLASTLNLLLSGLW
jgi:hypothetical protein